MALLNAPALLDFLSALRYNANYQHTTGGNHGNPRSTYTPYPRGIHRF